MFSQTTRLASFASVVALVVGVTACNGNNTSNTTESPQAEGSSPATETAANSNVSGTVTVDGSSTVFPIAEAMAEEFQKANPNVRVTVGSSGTGGGFKKFCNGETDISNASRPIKAEEVELCKKGNVEYIELPVSFDGIAVVVNPKNDFVDCLKVDELKKMWEPAAQGKVEQWSQVRSGLPAERLGLYGPGTDSGTFDYFTNAVVGEEGESRGDFTASEDDNTLVQGVASDEFGLGYFGYAYYEQNKDKLKLVGVDNGKGCVQPSTETISNGTYQPLARPEFIYVKNTAADRPEVKAFVEFFTAQENGNLVSEVGYVALPDDIGNEVRQRFTERKVGSIFEGKGSTANVTLAELLKQGK